MKIYFGEINLYPTKNFQFYLYLISIVAYIGESNNDCSTFAAHPLTYLNYPTNLHVARLTRETERECIGAPACYICRRRNTKG